MKFKSKESNEDKIAYSFDDKCDALIQNLFPVSTNSGPIPRESTVNTIIFPPEKIEGPLSIIHGNPGISGIKNGTGQL